MAGQAAKERVFAEEGTLNALEGSFFDTEEAGGVKGIYFSVSVRGCDAAIQCCAPSCDCSGRML